MTPERGLGEEVACRPFGIGPEGRAIVRRAPSGHAQLGSEGLRLFTATDRLRQREGGRHRRGNAGGRDDVAVDHIVLVN